MRPENEPLKLQCDVEWLALLLRILDGIGFEPRFRNRPF